MLTELTSKHLKPQLGPEGKRLRLHLDFDVIDGTALGRFDSARNRIILNLKNRFVAAADRDKNEPAIRLAAVTILTSHALNSGNWQSLLNLDPGPGAVGALAESVKLTK